MPPKFDGEGSLVDYMVQFEVTAEIYKWNKNGKAKFLAISLGGKARDIFGTLRADDVRNYDCLVKALRQKFDPPELAEMYKVQLRERRRKAGENLPDFASCIRMIVKKAYPTSSDFIKEEMAKDHFVQYFGNGQMRMLVSQARPRDLNSALHHAMELEAIKCSDPDTRTAYVTNVKDKLAKKSTDLGNKEMKVLIMALSEEIKLLKQKVETKERTVNSLNPNSSGLFVEGLVEGDFTEMLIDTGAGLSMLSIDCYKSMANPPPLMPVTCRLFQVDGTPLQVIGRTLFNFEIGGMKFKYPFAVLNMATSAILGFDFLTDENVILNIAQREVYVDGYIIECYTKGAFGVCRVKVEEDIVLLPGYEQVVNARIDSGDKSFGRTDSIIEPLKDVATNAPLVGCSLVKA
ncbi:hypothetical protein LOTGIDRAFT_163171 [Lottia gigantea]|uniref:Peptidase A2 domain-containing protein n=1 Tax=Lottia gigantea TaxID=225164 RepID=V4AEN3_LOTGI|nr:hypothetical protein LOTGIDRAFT_163171 [Lottia gigantea]ESO91811.1 hypothetical protein LOTGIDRAFT_163171 [Lottia gigantea]